MNTESAKTRSQPTIPGPIGNAVEKARKIADAVDVHGAEIPVKTATGSEIRTVADVLLQEEAAFRAIRSSFGSTLLPNRKAINAEAGRFLTNSKKPISCVLGDQWNPGWIRVGYLQNTLRCPSKIVDRIALLDQTATFLEEHPECEAKEQQITAIRARELHEALRGADQGKAFAGTESNVIRGRRDRANTALRKLVAGVISEVRRKLPADSALWPAFGLTPPKRRTKRVLQPKATDPATRNTAPAASPAPAPVSVSGSAPAPAATAPAKAEGLTS